MVFVTITIGKYSLTNPIRDSQEAESIAYNLSDPCEQWVIISQTPETTILQNGRKRSHTITYTREG